VRIREVIGFPKRLTPFYTGRTCNPELYGIRELLYGHIQDLASLLPEGPPRNIDRCKYDIGTSCKLIQLFDNVLQEEYSQEHGSLPLIHRTEKPPTCDFCGCNLFLSVLRCSGGCGIDETTAATICPSCFVEGRTCICGNMIPSRFRSFSTVLEQRNLAAATLRSLQDPDMEGPMIHLDDLYEK
jgi:hypothetical protein